MKQSLALLPLLLLAALLAAGTAAAQAPVAAALSAPAAPLTVGDPVPLTLTVTHPATYRVIPPEFPPAENGEAAWGDFLIQGQTPAALVDNGDGTVTTTIVIDARLFAPGDYSTPPLAVRFTDGAGQLGEVTAAPAAVRIASVLVEGDTELRDIKPQAELPFLNLLPWLLGGLLLALLGGGAYLLWRRRQARLALAAVDNRAAHEIALDDLAAVERLGLPEQGRFKEHYSLVTDTVRRYIETAYGVPMMERTTAEMRAELGRTGLARETKQRLLAFLQESDLVKFADVTPRTADAYALLGEGRALIAAARPLPAPDTAVPPPGFSANGRGAPVEQKTHE